ncbi:hypothetical protein XENORESO_020711 [Xenotaenia resolanae]|uniref:Secreted protein n=1 Tax=Xenotaenia resolanae TaxID=208358 RepID=A0ABV0X6Y2_9TELE
MWLYWLLFRHHLHYICQVIIKLPHTWSSSAVCSVISQTIFSQASLESNDSSQSECLSLESHNGGKFTQRKLSCVCKVSVNPCFFSNAVAVSNSSSTEHFS